MSKEFEAVIEWMITVSRELGGAVTCEEALHIIIENIKNYYPHQTIAALIRDENNHHLTIKNSRNLSYSYVKTFNRLARGNVIDRIMMKHEHILINNMDPAKPDYGEIKLEHDFKHICLVPIIQNQRAVGYLHCDRIDGPLFTEAEARELFVIGYLIGQQIEKHELLFLTRHLARIDEASKALKYHAFLEQYHKEVARARTYSSPMTLMLFSVDNYTQYITTCGIAAGHALLEEIHHLIHGCVREIDVVGRFAANEFIVCMGGMSCGESLTAIENIRNVVQKQTSLFSGCPILISGVALTFEKSEDCNLPLEQIFSKLGSGLVMARKQGQNQVIAINPAGKHIS